MKCKVFEPSIIKDSEEYINISKAFGTSLVEKAGASTAFNSFVPINKVAQAKGLKSNRSLSLEINKLESKYISREVKVNGGTSYEILFSSLEPELQQKIRECETKSAALVPLNYQPPINFVSDKARLTSLSRMDIVKAALKLRKERKTQKEEDNGRAFRAKFFQDKSNINFEEDGFNGVYANLNIHSVFSKPCNARAKVIERFFLEFQEEFEKLMPSYIGTSIEDKPAWMKRGEKLHL